MNNDTQTQTITAAITLSTNESFTATSDDLAITSVALAGQTLAITGANDVTLASASGTGTIDKNNAGRLDITGGVTRTPARRTSPQMKPSPRSRSATERP